MPQATYKTYVPPDDELPEEPKDSDIDTEINDDNNIDIQTDKLLDGTEHPEINKQRISSIKRLIDHQMSQAEKLMKSIRVMADIRNLPVVDPTGALESISLQNWMNWAREQIDMGYAIDDEVATSAIQVINSIALNYANVMLKRMEQIYINLFETMNQYQILVSIEISDRISAERTLKVILTKEKKEYTGLKEQVEIMNVKIQDYKSFVEDYESKVHMMIDDFKKDVERLSEKLRTKHNLIGELE